MRYYEVLTRLRTEDDEVLLPLHTVPMTLTDEKFFPGFMDYMDKNRQLAELIVLEFTQAGVEAMGPLEYETLSALQNIGFRFSIDQITDMGADFRSLSRQGFSFAKITADRLLGRPPAVAGDIHPHDFADLLVGYGIELIADHIETEAQVLEILEFGIGYGQGFLFSPPRPVCADVLQGRLPVRFRRPSPRCGLIRGLIQPVGAETGGSSHLVSPSSSPASSGDPTSFAYAG
ncbi:EAL domain-containing protein [Breoghania sp.]|uniref:EAL domain-containing protein n=1 Tax=Breoghania sp. TaxID=2065378 RepID=UPI0026355FC9|nr:EAL domain-containing protein [Breoghania sp.]MDJ0930217.1 EAL domain-containing protein [Breoghania sp.]